jgi:hypothetical protein
MGLVAPESADQFATGSGQGNPVVELDIHQSGRGLSCNDQSNLRTSGSRVELDFTDYGRAVPSELHKPLESVLPAHYQNPSQQAPIVAAPHILSVTECQTGYAMEPVLKPGGSTYLPAFDNILRVKHSLHPEQ